MSKQMDLPEGVDPLPFINKIKDHLGNNLNEVICKSVSNLLALDYANRLKSEPDINEYIELCITRLKNHVGKHVILDNSFSVVMNLFTVAITPERDVSGNNDKNQEQSQDALIESIIGSHFGDLSPEEQANIKMILKDLLNGKNGKEIMEVVVSDPKFFYSIVVSAIRSQKRQEQVMQLIGDQMTKIMKQSNKVQRKTSGLKNTIGKLALAGTVLIAASVGLVIGGLALPVIIVPAVIAAIKYGPILGETLGNSAVNNSAIIKNELTKLDNIKSSIVSTKKTLNKAQNKTIEQSKPKTLSKSQMKNIAQKVNTTSKEKKTKVQHDNAPKQKSNSRNL